MLASRIQALALGFVLLGCGASEPPSVADGALPADLNDDHELALSERTQVAYASNVFDVADGLRLSRGSALLDIADFGGRPRFTLRISARGSSVERYDARFDLDELDLTSGPVSLAPAQGRPFKASVSRRSGDRPVESTEASAVLRLQASSGHRTRLAGEISTALSSTSATFRAELSVRCLVPLSALGQASNGAADPSVSDARELVEDTAFKTQFCHRYAYLR